MFRLGGGKIILFIHEHHLLYTGGEVTFVNYEHPLLHTGGR